ncbi:TAXI family TRAP transporter solute-binding subunit [Amorphus coralli]|uniref:TAXI family TRAP transporter solute-binding subunit n=1 Tax=Amorphus coralli TaxID=340680 RepID=UPI0003FD05EF|nr:TAXI family TRAP transporter solute-binding subunit [Amorphus coralli]
MTMHKRISSALVAGLLVAGSWAGAAQAQEELRIGTASLGGAFYPVGQGIANLVSEHVDGVSMVPVVTQGSVQNPRLVDSGETDLGITNANLLFLAVNGEKPYPGKMEIAPLGALHPSILHIVTLDGSPIETFADLKGKRLAVGPAGGGTLSFLNRLLEAYDMTPGDITPSFLSYADGFSQLSDGNVDAALALSGYPSSAVMQTEATNKLKFVAIDDAKLAAILEKYPYYSKVTLPKDVYNLDGDAIVLGVNNVLIAPASMDDERAYAITKAVYDHLDAFAAENANAKQIDPAQSRELAVPLHPGAQRYFDETK